MSRHEKESGAGRWYDTAVFYEIFVRSFMDGNGDGVGDLEGIIAKADYLARLGITAVWLTPINKTSGRDYGYDVTDYLDIDPVFGDLGVFARLAKALHEKGVRIMLDLVANHTGIGHPWFEESRSSKTSPKRDWYIWRPGKPEGLPPNNWRNISTGESAWTLDERTGEYYFHQFRESQPDLNWRNPEVRKAIADIMRFWAERGADGFRIDALDHFLEDEELRDEPVVPPDPIYPYREPYYGLEHIYTRGQPETKELIRFFSETAKSIGDIFILNESYAEPPALLGFYDGTPHANHAPTIYNLVERRDYGREWKSIIDRIESALPPGYLRIYAHGNHDISRLATRVPERDLPLAAMLLLSLPGSPLIYYGEEIGMRNMVSGGENAVDAEDFPPFSRNVLRTPMQWDGSPYAGFSKTRSWLPAPSNRAAINVEALEKDPRSLLSLYKGLISLRKSERALSVGAYERVDTNDEEVHCFRRRAGEEAVIVCLNWSGKDLALDLGADSKVLISTSGRKEVPEKLAPHEGIIVKLS